MRWLSRPEQKIGEGMNVKTSSEHPKTQAPRTYRNVVWVSE